MQRNYVKLEKAMSTLVYFTKRGWTVRLYNDLWSPCLDGLILTHRRIARKFTRNTSRIKADMIATFPHGNYKSKYFIK